MTSNSEKITAFIIIELHFSEGIRQAVSQSVENCVQILAALKILLGLDSTFTNTGVLPRCSEVIVRLVFGQCFFVRKYKPP